MTTPASWRGPEELEVTMIRRFTRAAGRPALVVAAALALSACSIDGDGAAKPAGAPSRTVSPALADNGVAAKPAAAILDDAVAALQRYRSMRVKGSVRQDGTDLRLDMRVSGHDVQGELTVPIGGKPVPAEVVIVGKDVYMRGSELWASVAGPEAAKLMGDRWMKTPADNDIRAFVDWLTPDVFAKELRRMAKTATKGQPAVVDGRPAIPISDKEGTLYITTTGEPLPVKIAPSGSASEGITLSEFGGHRKVAPPADAIDPTKIRPST